MENWNEGTEEETRGTFARETSEVDDPLEPQGEVIPPTGGPEAEDSFPLESLITPKLCGMMFSIPGAMQAKRTGHDWWRLDEEEKQMVGEATSPLMVYLVRKYLGEGVGMFAAATVALSVVYGPRQMREMQEAAQEKKGPQSTQQANRRTSPKAEASAPSSANEGAENQSSNGDFSVPFHE